MICVRVRVGIEIRNRIRLRVMLEVGYGSELGEGLD